MKSRFTRSLVAMIALVAMLTQNAYGVYAAALSTDAMPIVERAEDTEIIVDSEPANTETPSDQGTDVNYDDQVVAISEIAPEEGTTPAEEVIPTEDGPTIIVEPEITEEILPEEVTEVIQEETAERLDILSSEISGAGLDSLEVFIDTSRLNTGDTFRINFSGAVNARYDSRLNDNLDTTAQGLYRFLDLNKESFTIRAESSDNVKFEYSSDNGTPVINVISVENNADKQLYTKTVNARDGKPVTAVFGEGYSSVKFKVDTAELAPNAEYTIYVDTEADVNINGSAVSYVSGNKDTETIELSNLDKKQFTIYITENEGFEITTQASISSVENGEAIFYVKGAEIRTKRVYTYSDADVTVTATLQFADAVPDDAEFRVTPITNQKAVNAYIDALNNADAETEYTEENTLLYDIAFLVDKTDDDGNVIPGEKVEFEPEVGSVTIEIRFNKSQLSDELGATDGSEVKINHLPLTESVKESVDTTVEATNISASDVIVEPVNANVDVVENGADTATLSLSDLSVVAVTSGSNNYTPGTSRTFADFLGAAKNIGVVANKVSLAGHLETNIATKELTGGNGPWAGPRNDGYAGKSYIGSFTGTNGLMIDAGNSGNGKGDQYVYTTPAAAEKFGSNTVIMENGKIKEYKRSGFQLDFSMSQSEINSYVDSIISYVKGTSQAAFAEKNAFDFTNVKSTNTIDIRSKGAGTYYINFDAGEYTGQELNICLNDNQTVVLNIPDTKVKFGQYKYTIGNGNSTSTQGATSDDTICQKVIFNCPNATYAESIGATSATFLVPNAQYDNNSVAAGWLVANNITKIGGQEWHCVFHDMPDPTGTAFSIPVTKTYDGDWSGKTFEFKIEKVSGNDTPFSFPSGNITATEANKNPSFTGFTFGPYGDSNDHTYIFKITEVKGSDLSIEYDASEFYVKVVAKTANNKTTATATYYNGPVNNGAKVSKIEFVNKEDQGEAKFKFGIKKRIDGGSAALTDTDKNQTFKYRLYETGSDMKVSNGSTVIDEITVKGGITGSEVIGMFKELEYKKEKFDSDGYARHYYVIQEILENGQGDEWDSGVYEYVHVLVKIDRKYNVTAQYGYKDIDNSERPNKNNGNFGITFSVENLANNGTILCVNTKKSVDADVEIKVKKNLVGQNAGALNNTNFTFKITPVQGSITPHALSDLGTNFSNPTVTVTGGAEGSFGTIHLPVDMNVNSMTPTTVDNNAYVEGYGWGFKKVTRVYGYMIEEEHPANLPMVEKNFGNGNHKYYYDATTGIYYDAAVYYVKVFHESYSGNGKSWVTTWCQHQGYYGYPKNDYEFNNGVGGVKVFTGTSCKKLEGDVEFYNGYEAPTGSLKVTKEVKSIGGGAYTTDDTFYFIVKDSKGNQVGEVHSIKQNETVTVSGLPVGTYEIVEVTSATDLTPITGAKYDPETPKVSVTANNTASVPLVKITNEYDYGSLTWSFPIAKKTIDVTQYEISDGQFEFTLDGSGPAGMTVPMPDNTTVKVSQANTNNAVVDFGSIEFREENVKSGSTSSNPTVYEYTISEVYVSGQGFAKNTEKYKFSIGVFIEGNKVKSVNDGPYKWNNKTSAWEKWDGKDVTFTNQFECRETLDFSAKKVLSGRNLSANEFTFKLEGVNDNAKGKMPSGAANGVITKTNTVSNTNEDIIQFGSVEFTQADINKEFKYKITEPGVNADGVVFDASVYEITVVPKLGANNKFYLDKTVTKDSAADSSSITSDGTIQVLFSNVYNTTGGADLTFTKAVTGNMPKGTVFTFELYRVGADGAAAKIAEKNITWTNGGEGTATVTFTNDDCKNNELSFSNSDIGKTYEYYCVETHTGIGTTVNGITYDTAEHHCSITVSDAGKGALAFDKKYLGTKTSPVSPTPITGQSVATFNNSYAVTPVPGEIDGKKELAGRVLKADEFSFTLTAVDPADSPLPSTPTVTNAADGTFKFDAVQFTAPGTYKYKVSEVIPSTKLQGVTYTQDYYFVTFNVTDNGNGTLSAAKSITKVIGGDTTNTSTSNAVVFNNTYGAEGEVVLHASKSVTGTTVKGGQFWFGLYDETKTLLGSDYLVNETSGGNVQFKKISYTLADLEKTTSKVFTYYIHELSTADELKDKGGLLPGYTYDTNWYKVEVTVSDNGNGTLTATEEYFDKAGSSLGTTAPILVNDYTVEGKTQIYVQKQIIGDTSYVNDDDVFTFKLYAADGSDKNIKSGSTDKLVDVITINGSDLKNNSKSATVAFDKVLEYTAAGEYKYTVVEEVTGTRNGNIVYDTAVKDVTVKATDNGNGTLTVVPTPGTVGSPVVVSNKVVTPGEASFTASKISLGRDLAAESYEFTLKEISYTKPDTTAGTPDSKVYKAKNKSAAIAGTPALVELATISYGKELAGQHVYEIAEVIPSGATPITYTTDDGTTVTGMYKDGVTYDNAKFYAVVNVVVDSDNNLTVTGPVYYSDSALQTPVAGANVKFTNAYTGKTTVQFEGVKKLYRDADKSHEIGIASGSAFDGKFSFTLRRFNNSTSAYEVVQTVVNNGEKFTFDEIEFTETDLNDLYKVADNKYRYAFEIEEVRQGLDGVTYDTSVYDAFVDISVGKNGKLTAVKTVQLRSSDVPANTGLWNRIKAFVTGNSDNVIFKNVYNASGKLKLGVTKTLTGMNWGDATSFDFQLKEGSNVITQLINGEKDHITVTKNSAGYTEYFNEITYTLDDLYTGSYKGSREYTYTVKEVVPNKDSKIPGVAYDETEHKIVVTVTDMHNGKLKVTAAVDGGTAVESAAGSDGIMVCNPGTVGFTNTYGPDPTSVEIEGTKELIGKTLAADEFSFSISAKSPADAPLPAVTVVKNAADKKFKFGPINYTPEMFLDTATGIYADSKTFTYIIKEDAPAGAVPIFSMADQKIVAYKVGNYTYDAVEREVTVTVKNEAGKLSATVAYDQSNGLQFTNYYDEPGSTALSVQKIVNGTDAADKDFTFTLKSLTAGDPNRTSANVELIDTVTAKNKETVSFKTLNYSVQNTLTNAAAQGSTDTAVYKYEICEERPSAQDGYTYSQQVYTATVTVKANANGTLTITKSVVETASADGAAIPEASQTNAAGDVAVFTNTYYAEGYTQIGLTKVLSGKDISADEFTFYLKDEAGNILETRKSNAVTMDSLKKAYDSYTFGGNGDGSPLKYTVDDLKNGTAYAGNKILYYTMEELIPSGGETVTVNGKTYTKVNNITYDNGIYVVAVFINNPGTGALEVSNVFQRFESDRTAAIASMKTLVNTKMASTNKSFKEKVAEIAGDNAFAQTAAFNNTYSAAGSWDPQVYKSLSGKSLDKDEFTFELVEYEVKNGAATSNVINRATGTNAGTGANPEKIVFAPGTVDFLTYGIDDVGLHVYGIKEVIPNGAADVKDSNNNVVAKTLNGITYDITEVIYNVTVADNGDGTLSVTSDKAPSQGDVSFTFNNKYEAAGSIDLHGSKALEGRDWSTDDVYTFGIKEVTSGAKDTTEYTVTNKNSAIDFLAADIPVLNYSITDNDRSAVGEHKYEIREISGSKVGVTYDDTVYTVTVTVTDNGQGSLSAAVTQVTYPLNNGAGSANYDFTADGSHSFSFKNKYEAKVSLEFTGLKHLRIAPNAADITNEGDLNNKFTFALYEYDPDTQVQGKLVGSGKSTGTGAYTITGPGFTQEDLKKTGANETGYYDSIKRCYQIVEIKYSDGDWKNGVFTGKDGITYDNTVYNIEVTISKPNGDSDKLDVSVKNLDTGNSVTAVRSADNDYKYIIGTPLAATGRQTEVGDFDFVNLKTELISIGGKKIWRDNVTDPTTRPTVYIDLYRSDNMNAPIDTYTINPGNDSYVFANLPKNDDSGAPYTYYVQERSVAGYQTTMVTDPDSSYDFGYNFINTKGKITINKIDAETKQPLAGATLQILDGTTVVEEWTTDADNNPHVVNAVLTVGKTYKLHEKSAPTGYELAADQTFEVPADGGDITVTMEDTAIVGALKLTKLDADTKDKLAGAEFALFRMVNGAATPVTASSNNASGVYIYDKNVTNTTLAVSSVGTTIGTLTISGLPYGDYYFTETKAPTGYALNTNKIKAAINSTTTVEVSCENEPNDGKVYILKRNADDNTPLAGAVLEIYAADDKGKRTGDALEQWTSDTTAHEVKVKLTRNKTYVLHEVSAPTGFTLAADQTFVAPSKDATLNVEMYDKAIVGEVRLVKYEKGKTETLSGAEFNLYKKDGTLVHAGTTSKAGVYNYSSSDKNTRLVVNSDGILRVKGLPYGEYYFVETKAPADHKLDANPLRFTVDGSVGQVGVKAYNESDDGLIYIKKVDKNGIGIVGAELGVFEVGADGKRTGSALYSHTWITDGNAYLYPYKLTAGKEYILHEISVPTGYAQAEDEKFKAPQPGKEVHVEMIDELALGNVTLTKLDKDTGAALAGAEFELFRKSDNKPVYVSKTLTPGIYEYSETATPQTVMPVNPLGILAVNNIPYGDYYFVEVKAPDGYTLNTDKIPVIIDATKSNVSVDCENTHEDGKIFIRKVDSKTSGTLTGAVLEIYAADTAHKATGKALDRWTSEVTPHEVTVVKLERGKEYVLHEVSAPYGYVVAPDQTFTVPADYSDLTVVMKDDPATGKVTLTKLDADAATRTTLSGAEFALYKYGTNERIYATGSAGSYAYSESATNGRYVVNAAGTLEVTGLPYGEYYFVETVAPAGFALNTSRLYFTISGTAASASVECRNVRLDTIRIRKIDADTRLPLAGAVLQIRTTGGAVLDEWTSTTSDHVVPGRTLTPGTTYVLHEVSAPSGYLVASDITFTAPSYGSTITVTMEDRRVVGNVRLVKRDAATRATLAGAEFALYREDGTRVYAAPTGTAGVYAYSTTSSNGRFIVNAAGEVSVTGLPYGTYYFLETVAPAGYTLNTARIPFTVIESGRTYDVECLNTRERGSVRLTKTNAAGTVSLAGAVFELYARTPSTIAGAIASTIYGGTAYYRVGTYTTDASGTIYVGDLPWDDYYFLEVSAPTGYVIGTDVTGDRLVYPFSLGTTGTATVGYTLGVRNSTSGGGGGEVLGVRTDGGRTGGVLSGVLGVRAAPKQGVLGERLGPVTGDATSIILWLLLLIASISAIVGVVIANAKRKRRAV